MKVKSWHKSEQNWEKYLLLLKKSKFETSLIKRGGNICIYWEVKIWECMNKSGGKYLLYLLLSRKSKFETNLHNVMQNICFYQKSQNFRKFTHSELVMQISASIEKVKIRDKSAESYAKYLLLLIKSKFETNLQKLMQNICFHWESQNLRQICTKWGKMFASIVQVEIWDKSI